MDRLPCRKAEEDAARELATQDGRGRNCSCRGWEPGLGRLLLGRVKVAQPSWGTFTPGAGKGQLAHREPLEAPVKLAPAPCSIGHHHSQRL